MLPARLEVWVLLLCLFATSVGAVEEQLVVRSADLVVRLQNAEAGFDIASVHDASSGTRFMDFVPDPDYGKLWEIELRANHGRGEPLNLNSLVENYECPPTEEVVVDNHSTCLRTEARRATDGNALVLRWAGIELPGDAGDLDVTVRIEAQPDTPGVRWRIRVDNRAERFGTWVVRFPIIRAQPIGGDGSNDSLIWPKGAGRVVPNPFSPENGVAYRFINLHLDYPSPQYNMQFGALYDPEAGGLYWGAHDPRARHKRFAYHAREDGVWFRLEHFPEDMGQPGAGFVMDYPLVLRSTPGHWWDAAQIYREWALQQNWTSKGPLYQREDIPRWYREAALYLVAYSKGDTVGEMAESAAGALEYFEVQEAVPLNWYNWNQWAPEKSGLEEESAAQLSGDPFPAKDGFADALSRLAEAGAYVQPYFDVRLFDMGPGAIPERWLPWTVKDVNGIPRPWTKQYPRLIDMCYGTEFFQTYVEAGVARLARDYGARGAYLDQFGTIQHACFDPAHAHPLGTSYQTDAIREIARRARSSARSVDPNAVFSGENGADCTIDVLDGMLLHNDIYPGLTPVAPAVYGDYWILCGRALHTPIARPQQLRMTLGNLLCHGIKLGRFAVNNFERNIVNYSEGMELVREAVRMRRAAADYLQFGRMLRPIDFESEIPVLKLRTPRLPEEYDSFIYQPGIMSSVWEAPEGSIGVMLFNISQKPQSYRFTLRPESYPLPNGPVVLSRLGTDGEATRLRIVTGSVAFDGDLAVDEIRFFILRGQREHDAA